MVAVNEFSDYTQKENRGPRIFEQVRFPKVKPWPRNVQTVSTPKSSCGPRIKIPYLDPDVCRKDLVVVNENFDASGEV